MFTRNSEFICLAKIKGNEYLFFVKLHQIWFYSKIFLLISSQSYIPFDLMRNRIPFLSENKQYCHYDCRRFYSYIHDKNIDDTSYTNIHVFMEYYMKHWICLRVFACTGPNFLTKSTRSTSRWNARDLISFLRYFDEDNKLYAC